MIVLSFLLVVIAAVTLLVGLFQDTLTWIWISIGACVLAMIFLGIGVLQRRSGRREPEDAEEPAYGPGAITSLIPGGEDEEEEEEEPAAAGREEITVVPKRSVSDARGEMSRAEVEEAADQAVAKAEAEAPAERATAKKRAATKVAKKAAKKSVKKAQKRSTKKTAKKAQKRSTKKTAKKAAKKTTGKAARERLDQVKGLGPAKQKALLAQFGSLEGIRDAEVEDLLQVKGVGEATAEEIRKQLS